MDVRLQQRMEILRMKAHKIIENAEQNVTLLHHRYEVFTLDASSTFLEAVLCGGDCSGPSPTLRKASPSSTLNGELWLEKAPSGQFLWRFIYKDRASREKQA